MNGRSSIARNVVSNWAVLAANMAYGLFITPVVVLTLNTEQYGVWAFLNGLLAYSELLYFGLGSALIKDVARLRAGADDVGVSRLTSLVATIYTGIGLACLAALTVLSGFVPGLFASPLSTEAASAASTTCLLLGARLAALFAGSAFSGLLAGFDRFDLSNAVQLAAVLIRFVATPFVVRAGPNPLVMLAALSAAVGIAEAIALAIVAHSRVAGLVVRAAKPSYRELRALYGFGLQSFFILLAVKISGYTDTTVIGLTIGAAGVALFALPLQLIEYTRMAIGGFSGVLLPRLSVLAARQARDELGALLIRASRLGFVLAAWMVSTLIAIGPEFLSLWISAEFGAPARWILIWLGLASWLHIVISMVPLAFYQALQLMARPAIVFTIEAVANLGLSLWLSGPYGITGVALGTLLPVPFVSFVLLPPYLCRQLGVPFGRFVAQAMTPGAILFAVNLAAQGAMAAVVGGASYGALATRVVLSVPIAAAVVMVTFPADDRHALSSQLVRLLPWRTRGTGSPR